MYLFTDFTIVLNLLKCSCSSHFVFVFIVYLCGSHLVPTAKGIGRFKAAYHKCFNNFFRFARCNSIIADLGLPSLIL